MKYATARPMPTRKRPRRILEIANSVEPIQGRIHIEKMSGTFVTARRRPILRVIAKTVSHPGDAIGGRGLATFCPSGALSSSCVT